MRDKASIPELTTVGVISRELKAPMSRVTRALRRLGITPAARVGTVHVYRPEITQIVKAEIERINDCGWGGQS